MPYRTQLLLPQGRSYPTGNKNSAWVWNSHPCASALTTGGPFTVETCFFAGDTSTATNFSAWFGLQSTVTGTNGYMTEYNPAAGTEPDGIWLNHGTFNQLGIGVIGSVQVAISNWNYAAMTFDGTNWQAYVRFPITTPLVVGGSSTTSTVPAVDLTGGVNVALGEQPFSPNGMLNGRIAFTRIWKRRLSQGDLEGFSQQHLPRGRWGGMVFHYDAANSREMDTKTTLVETAYGLRSSVANVQTPTPGPINVGYVTGRNFRTAKHFELTNTSQHPAGFFSVGRGLDTRTRM